MKKDFSDLTVERLCTRELVMTYRELTLNEVERIREIDAECYIQNAWRKVDGVLQLVTIDWTDHELPNGLEWHSQHYTKSLEEGEKAFGCFDHDKLVGYAVIDATIFGINERYVLLDQIFISKDYRGQGIGKELFYMCSKQAVIWGADKLYICAGSSEDTIAFYHKLGCVDAKEVNQELYELDPNDIQLEFSC